MPLEPIPPRHHDGIPTTALVATLALFVALALVLGAVFYSDRILGLFSIDREATEDERLADLSSYYDLSNKSRVHADLLQSDASFREAENMRVSGGDPAQILALYRNALKSATADDQRGQVLYLQAVVTWKSGDERAAIQQLKTIAENKSFPARLRASAIQEMVLIPHTLAKNDPVTVEIFKDEPYASLLVDGDTYEAYRSLLKYASAIYPLSIAELLLANAELGDIMWQKTGLSESLLSADALKASALRRIATADRELERMRGVPGDDEQVPVVLLYRAQVVGKLNHLGDLSLGSGEDAYQAALDAYTTRGLNNVFANYGFAIYLAWKENPDATRVRTVLTPVYDPTTFGRDALIEFLTSVRSAPDTSNNKQNAVAVSRIDPDFGQLLKTLGWTARDLSIDLDVAAQQ